MTGNRDLFSDLEEKDLQHNIEFGDDGGYNTTRIGTISFQMESNSPLKLADFLYVPCLRNNIFSIAVLEDRGYDVIFIKGKVFLKHISMGRVKQISVRVKNMYALEVKDA